MFTGQFQEGKGKKDPLAEEDGSSDQEKVPDVRGVLLIFGDPKNG